MSRGTTRIRPGREWNPGNETVKGDGPCVTVYGYVDGRNTGNQERFYSGKDSPSGTGTNFTVDKEGLRGVK